MSETDPQQRVELAFEVGGRGARQLKLSGRLVDNDAELLWRRRRFGPATVRGVVGSRPFDMTLRPAKLTRGGAAEGRWGTDALELTYTVDFNDYRILGHCGQCSVDLAATKLRHGPIVVHASAGAESDPEQERKIRLELTNEKANPGVTGEAAHVTDALVVAALAGELLHEVRKNAYVNFDETKLGRDLRALGPGDGTLWNPRSG